MKEFMIGEKYEEFIGPEGAFFDLKNSGGELYIRFPRATKTEIEAVKSGNVKYGVTYINDIIWLTWKFGNLDYLETPFSWSLVQSGTNIPEIPEDAGLGVVITMVDGDTGELYANRLIGLSTLVSRKLMDLIIEQPHLSKNEINKKIAEVQMRYDSNRINQLALATDKIIKD